MQKSIDTKGKMVVLSDIHFGVKKCSLGKWVDNRQIPNTAKRVVEGNIKSFIDYLKEMGNVKKVMLLGDIFDLHLSNLTTSIKASISFFEQLRSIKDLNEIIWNKNLPDSEQSLMVLSCQYLGFKQFNKHCDIGKSIIINNPYNIVIFYAH